MPPHSARFGLECGNRQKHAPTTTLPQIRIKRVKMPYLSDKKKFQTFLGRYQNHSKSGLLH